MNDALKVGLTNQKCLTVDEAVTAAALKSGSLPVLGTPAVAALMEATACESVTPYLGEGETTVGSLLNIRHLSPDPVGATVICKSLLTAAEGKKLTFSLLVLDHNGIAAEGEHQRFIVESRRFLEKAEGKGKKRA